MRQFKDKGHISYPQEKPQSTSTGGEGEGGQYGYITLRGGGGGACQTWIIYPLITDSILLMEEIRANQLRLVVYPIIYRVLAPSQVVQDFFHQQYVYPMKSKSHFKKLSPNSSVFFFLFRLRSHDMNSSPSFTIPPLKGEYFLWTSELRYPCYNVDRSEVEFASSTAEPQGN